MDKLRQEINFSWTSLWRILLMLFLAVIIFLTRQVLLVLFLAIILSAAFDTPVSYLEKKRIPRILSTVLIYLLVLAVLSLVIYTVIPSSIVQLSDFLSSAKKLSIPIFGAIDFPSIVDRLNKSLLNYADTLFSGGVSFLGFVSQIFGNIILIITTFVLSFYLTVNRGGVEKFIRAVLPASREDYYVDFYWRVKHKLGLWLQGQFVLMVSVGVLVFLGLLILGVKYSLSLGIIAGLLEIVPIAGPIFAGMMTFLAAISDSFTLAFYSVMLFIVIQQLESNILVPLIMRRAVGISPVVVVISILMGAELAGIVGIFVAVPVAVIIQELVEDWGRIKMRDRDSRLHI